MTPCTSPLLLEQMIKFISDPDAPDSDGYTIAAFLFVVPFISALCSSHNYHNATRAWQHVRAPSRRIAQAVLECVLSRVHCSL